MVNRQRSSTYPSRRDRKDRSLSPESTFRPRLLSSEIPRTYSGLYGQGGENCDLLPFELSRNCNTDWLYTSNRGSMAATLTGSTKISSGEHSSFFGSSLFWIYMSIIAFIQLTVMLVLPLPYFLQPYVTFETSWTFTNVLHGFMTTIFLHWLKGSPNFYEQGELNAMTLWEQLLSAPDNEYVAYQSKMVFLITPTVLCYVACFMSGYDRNLSLVNLFTWMICTVAKLEPMNGVRLFGWNRTVGIDDDMRAKSK
mmetsp:Transcript_18067/g.22121  ORF Transcript_18067/g.22121 Transcript_18067/m.22121 type:complete len:253 (+) Transcript_18067:303-1061(+)